MITESTPAETLDRIRQLHRKPGLHSQGMLKDLLLMFAEANKDPLAVKMYGDRVDGRNVPLVMLYPGSPVGEFDNAIPYLWSKLDEFVRSLGDSRLDQVNEEYGMIGDD